MYVWPHVYVMYYSTCHMSCTVLYTYDVETVLVGVGVHPVLYTYILHTYMKVGMKPWHLEELFSGGE